MAALTKLVAGLAILGVVAQSLAPTVDFAQPTAEKPTFKAGDRWVFNMVEGDKTAKWSREVVEVRQDGLAVKLGNGTVTPYDDAMNLVDPQGLDNSRILARYPLMIGAEWKYTRRPEQSGRFEERGSAKIVGYERITVRAGTFGCFRVDAEASTSYHSYSEHRLWNRWYCPEIKWIAKERVEVHTFNPGRGLMSYSVRVSELEKYTPGQQ
jgi:hypothetical protein